MVGWSDCVKALIPTSLEHGKSRCLEQASGQPHPSQASSQITLAFLAQTTLQTHL